MTTDLKRMYQSMIEQEASLELETLPISGMKNSHTNRQILTIELGKTNLYF
jgi:hypothetical protein